MKMEAGHGASRADTPMKKAGAWAPAFVISPRRVAHTGTGEGEPSAGSSLRDASALFRSMPQALATPAP